MKRIGAHVSISGGVFNAPLNAEKIGGKSFALFTKNQRQWSAKPYDSDTIDSFYINMEKAGFLSRHVLPHSSYLINLGNPDSEKRNKSLNAFIDELNRCNQLGLIYLNIHPGSHLNQISEEQCLSLIAHSCNKALDETKNVTIVLEITAGQGSSVGYTFDHLKFIIDSVEDKSRIGVCLDTCHAFAAGYDLRTAETCHEVFDSFDKIIGFHYLKGIHLNDAKSHFSSNVDRHECIGKGTLGMNVFSFIMNDSRFDEIPMVLETIDESQWPEEIKLLYGLEKK